MWNYEKRLQYPVNIKTPNAKLAGVIISQYGGPYSGTRELSKKAVPLKTFGLSRFSTCVTVCM